MRFAQAISDLIGRLFSWMLRHLVVPILILAVVAYFAHYALSGDRGLGARERMEARIAQAKIKLAEVSGERERMERRVDALKADRLDPDMLDERAREILNLARPDDVIVVTPPTGSAPSGK